MRPTESGDRTILGYLERYGYLAPAIGVRRAQADDPMSALRSFQSRMGLPVTGEVDPRTRQEVGQDRCGLPDLVNGLEIAAECSWTGPTLRYAFGTGCADFGPDAAFDGITKAFATWAAIVPLTFTEVGTEESPDVVVEWRPATDPDHSMVGGVLAHADFPGSCAMIVHGFPKPLHFDDSEHTWCDGAVTDAFDVQTVALHEIGHLLGLRHSTVRGSVMFPSIGDGTTLREPQPDDLAAIGALYPR